VEKKGKEEMMRSERDKWDLWRLCLGSRISRDLEFQGRRFPRKKKKDRHYYREQKVTYLNKCFEFFIPSDVFPIHNRSIRRQQTSCRSSISFFL
jgi:hypothetical protein